MCPAPNRTLLGVWAHPDDETYLSAGLMLEHVARGDRVVIITATLGEHGTDEPELWRRHQLGELRHRELRRSLATLGVQECRILGFEDGTCDRHDGTALVAQHIAEIRPDVIVTFGPDGMTGHGDHRAVSRWTTDAARTAAPEADLWYTTVTPDFHRTWGHVNALVGFWYDPLDAPSTPADQLCHTVALTKHQLDTKAAALRAHRSQTTRIESMIGRTAFREWWAIETFRRAARTGDRRADELVVAASA